ARAGREAVVAVRVLPEDGRIGRDFHTGQRGTVRTFDGLRLQRVADAAAIRRVEEEVAAEDLAPGAVDLPVVASLPTGRELVDRQRAAREVDQAQLPIDEVAAGGGGEGVAVAGDALRLAANVRPDGVHAVVGAAGIPAVD